MERTLLHVAATPNPPNKKLGREREKEVHFRWALSIFFWGGPPLVTFFFEREGESSPHLTAFPSLSHLGMHPAWLAGRLRGRRGNGRLQRTGRDPLHGGGGQAQLSQQPLLGPDCSAKKWRDEDCPEGLTNRY